MGNKSIKTNIFDHSNYADFLRTLFPKSGESRGGRAGLARHMGCQTSFISQILTDRAHLSLEQALKISDYLHLSKNEQEYFMLLVQRDRAGSKQLKEFFETKIKEIRHRGEQISESIQVTDIPTSLEQYVYYSSWIFSACHILCALPKYSDRDDLRRYLNIEFNVFENCLDFLKKNNFIEVNGKELKIKRTRVHLDEAASMISRHHVNWRQKAIEEIEKRKTQNLHFSGIFGISVKDGERIRNDLLKSLKSFEKTVSDSKEEEAFILLLDFWRL